MSQPSSDRLGKCTLLLCIAQYRLAHYEWAHIVGRKIYISDETIESA